MSWQSIIPWTGCRQVGRHDHDEFTQSVLDAIGANVAVLDRRGMIIMVNGTWQQFARENGDTSGGAATGVGVDYLSVVRAETGASTEGAAEVLVGIQDVLTGRSPEFTIEYPCHSPDEQRWFMLRARPLAGRAGGAVLTHINITERKQAEDALRESAQRIRLLLDSTAEGLYGVDAKGYCTFVNRAFLHLLGFEKEEDFLGRHIHELIHHTRPDGTPYPAEECRMYEALRRSAGIHVDDEVFWRRDGSSFPVEYWSHPMFIGGRIVGAVASFLDVTEHKRSVDALRKISAHQDVVLATVPSIIVETDNNKVYTWANRAGLKFFGDDVVGKEAEFFFEGEQETYRTVQPLFEGDEKVIYLESWQRRQDGEKRLLAWWCHVLKDAQGHTVGTLSTARDITAFKRAEAALMASEQEFRSMFEMASIGVAQADPHTGRWLRVNQKMCEITGYSVAEMLQMRIVDLTHPADQRKDGEAFQRVMRGETPDYRMEKRYLRKDGTVAWVNVNMTVIRDDANQPLRTMATIEDITERKHSEEILREKEHLLSEAERLGHVGSWLLEMGDKVSFSDEMYRILGVTQDTFTPTIESFLGLIHPGDRQAMQSWIAACAAGEKPGELEFRINYSDGTTRFILGRGELTADIEEGTTHMAGTAQDITERKAAEAVLLRLRDSLEEQVKERTAALTVTNEQLATEVVERKQVEVELRKLSRVVEQSPAIVVITDVDGTIEYVNPKFIEVTGYTTEEAIGQNPRFLQSKTHPPEFYEELWRTIKEGNVWHGEFCNKKKNGEIYFESATIAPNRDKQGQITHFVAIKEDITGQRRIAEELRQAKEAAEAANRAKSDFLASMSHELRTPLGAIIGFSELLEEKLFGDLTPKQDEYIKDILGSSRHLLSLINDVLDLAKVEAGKMDLVLSTFSIGTLLGSSLVMVKEKCLKHGITLSMKIADTITGLQITADERKLKQVMFNLLSNAVKFTPDEGVITVSVDFEKAEGAEQNPSATPALLINVSDTGIGIAKEHQEAVFAEFYQVDGGVKGKTPGTGLGLSLSRRLVELQGGRLWVGSEGEGKGSMFQFTIPIEAYESAGVVESGREGHSLVMRRVSDLVDRALASVDRFCLCRLEPLESMTAVAQEAMVHELNAGKRDHDSIVVDPKGHCVLMLSNTNRAGAEVACRRLAARLEKRLNVGWRWAVAVCPEDGRTAELLMESLRLRCGTAQQNEHENDGERRWAL